jgi:glycosyltransferase involved in cell wall biosynthesis
VVNHDADRKAGYQLGSRDVGSVAIEEVLCLPTPVGNLETLVPRTSTAWSMTLPGLTALPRFEGTPRRLRICIAREDIVGPVRNGGIGTTYAALAEFLAKTNHEVTILYLKGHEVENETLDHWVEHYGKRGIRFVPVPNYAHVDRYSAGNDRWVHASYNLMRYLIAHPTDVVHVSEWRGSGYLSLLAKHQGLALANTLFIVKTSSPWMWNRLYGLQPLEGLDDLARVHGERRSVELADMVIGGSLHLLRWMLSQGYAIAPNTTFVQPNVATYDHLAPLQRLRDLQYGTRQPIDEIVFFGRLEARKGLLIFIQAINRLLREKRPLPRVITFLGKAGPPLTERTGESVLEFIRSETSTWPTKVEIRSDLQQFEALEYLLGADRLAVMPSIIENSSLAVYEAAICRIPFIASDSGGTPELVLAADRPHVLCPAHPIFLAEKIAEAIERGAYVAAPSFDNVENLEQWLRFHDDLGRGLLEHLLPPPAAQPAGPTGSISVCIYHIDDDDRLMATLSSLKEQQPSEILVAVDTEDASAVERLTHAVAETGLRVRVLPAFDLGAGAGFNLLASASQGDHLLFLWSGAVLAAGALPTFEKAAEASRSDLMTCLFRVRFPVQSSGRSFLSAKLLGDSAQGFFHTDVTPMPLFIRRAAFDALGGFTADYGVLAHDHELVAKAQLSGFACQTVLQELCSVDGWDDERLHKKKYSRAASEFRSARPLLAAAPLALRETLLMAKGLQRALGRRGRLGGSAVIRRSAALTGGRMETLLGVVAAPLRRIGWLPEPKPRRPRRRMAGALQPAAKSTRMAAAGDSAGSAGLGVHWQASDGSRYAGRVFGVHKGVVYGWVKDLDHPRRLIEIEGVIDRRRARTVLASIGSPPIAYSNREALGCAFAFEVWRGPFGFKGDWRTRELTISIKGTDIVLGEFSIPANASALAESGHEGYCDVIDSRIRGWVWQPDHPEQSVEVAAFVDGKFLARTIANGVRHDLRALNIGTGAYGFQLAVPRALRDGQPHRIDVVVADNGVVLNRGRLLLKGNRLSEAGKSKR